MNGGINLTATQHRAAIDRAGENLALLSGAGCGKTMVLGRRFTELLLKNPDVENPLSRFVALTFTEKAAIEMSQRVRKFIKALAASSKGDDRRRLARWVEQLPEARISTIHGFCSALLRGQAIEAGIDPEFSICSDEFLTIQMINQAAENAVLASLDVPDSNVGKLLTMFSFEKIVRQVVDLIEKRTACDLKAYADPEAMMERWGRLRLEHRQRAWEHLAADDCFLRELDDLGALPCDNPDDKLCSIRDEILATAEKLIKESPSDQTAEAIAHLKELKTGNLGSYKAWGGKDQLKRVRRRIKAIRQRLVDLEIYEQPLSRKDKDAADGLAALTKLAREANELYKADKRKRGILDFNDLLALAHELLSNDQDLRKQLAGQIDQLLIDECQDTNAFQISLLSMLVSPQDPNGEVPDGKLFVVGDAKQSIYRFRGAQVEVFEELCRRLGPGQRENLQISFRTNEAGVAFINHLFAPLMDENYSPIKAHRKNNPPLPPVEIILAAGSESAPIISAETATGAQAAATAQRICEMLEGGGSIVWNEQTGEHRPAQPGDIAILFSRMTHSLAYERQLSLRGIPYYVVGGTGFFKQQEVYDILNALKVIDNPFDDIAFFGILRSTMFGLDDNTLMHIAQVSQPPYLPNIRPSELTGRVETDQLASLKFAVELLRRLHHLKDAVGIDRLIETILAETGYEAVLLAQFGGRRMLGNVRRIIEQARSASASSLTLDQFINQANEQVISEFRSEQVAVAGESENVVRLMTIHKAKGLEFPIVFIPDLNAARQGYNKPLLNRNDWGLTYKAIPADSENAKTAKEEDRPVSYRIAKALEDADQLKEDIRKLYVAATRHRDHLVLVGADCRSKDGLFTSGSRGTNNDLNLIDGVLQISEAIDAGAETISYGNGYSVALRRFLPSPPIVYKPQKTFRKKLSVSSSSPADLVRAILSSTPAAESLPLVGTLPTSIGRAEVAATALIDFAFCPMLYRWRHELRVPTSAWSSGAQPAGEGRPGLDAATTGSLFHRCMELLNFQKPQPASSLLTQAADEMQLPELVDVEALSNELAGMLKRFSSQKLWAEIAIARQEYRELDFMMEQGSAVIRGQIDLLYHDSDGGWHIVDYKSDRVTGGEIESHGRRYELQMLLYAAAAAKFLGQPPADAIIYFLRPGKSCCIKVMPKTIENIQSRITTLASELIATRRNNSFACKDIKKCRSCPYQPICFRN